MVIDSRKKILLIDNSIAFTGALKSAIQEAGLFSGQFEFIFVIPEKNTVQDKIISSGFRIYPIPMIEISRSWKNILLYIPCLIINYFRLRKIVEKERVDIIQVNDFYNLLGAMLKIFGFKGKLITYVRFLPSTLPKVLRQTWTWIARKYSYRVICVSDAVKKQMPEKENIIRIYNPVSLEEKYNETASTEKIKLLYPANYILGKGQGYALEAFDVAYKKNQNLKLKFVGGDMGLEKNRNKKKDLIKRASELRIGDVVEFAEFASNVEKEIRESDIVLNFSKAESFSMTCLEASFYGRPVIATRCGGPEEIIDHNKTGLLVKNMDVEEMTNAILELAKDKEKRIQFGIAGRKYVQAKFNADNFKKELGQVFS